MIKILVFVPALPGLSKSQFKSYYEDRHAPLLRQLLPMMNYYKRNYPNFESARLASTDVGFAYDAITEVGFADAEAYSAFLDLMKDTDVVAQIRADEARFCDSAKVIRFKVDLFE